MKFNELIIADDSSITENQKEFLTTHRAIVNNGTMLVENALQFAYNLKKMKDEKLYIEAGFENFGEYTEKACGLKERQSYNYLKIVENLPEDFLHSNAKIGITKLTLLAGLGESERETVVHDLSIEDTSTRELKEKIKKIEKEKDKQSSELESLKGQLSFAEQKLQEVESESETQVEEKISAEREKISKTVSKLKEEIEQLKNKPKETVTIENKETLKQLEELKINLEAKSKTLSEQLTQIELLKKQLELKSNDTLVEFKLKFEEFQVLGENLKQLIPKLPIEKQEKFKKALKAVAEVLIA